MRNHTVSGTGQNINRTIVWQINLATAKGFVILGERFKKRDSSRMK